MFGLGVALLWQVVVRQVLLLGGGGGGGGGYAASLDFSDARNSQYVAAIF